MSDKFVKDMDSFAAGVCTALACLKIAIQNSPGFDQTRLEEAIKGVLSAPSSQVDQESFAAPLNFLLNQHSYNASQQEDTPPQAKH
ncbi:hypothetical protein [Achromobacter animicus]|uniref:hypothetical protein n=1 Tax=Achromobacter animicus TaxID=1389935 RepID=UPI0014683541|nr:hypothetical protein [Achromobacter animicus]CAB3850328.1 hypothetical protein LMG26691_01949 [Achromobacter animicus]